MKAGGCITRRWTETLDVSEQVVDLLASEPELVRQFERLHEAHSRRLPRVLGWGDTFSSERDIDPRRTAKILTSCTKSRGLHSSCWFVTRRRRS